MKLLQKYSRANLISSVIIFLLASVAFYFSLHYVLLKQVDEDLKAEKHEIEISVARYGKLPDIIPMSDEITKYKEATSSKSDIIISSVKGEEEAEEEGEDELFRKIIFYVNVNGRPYQVSVSKSLENTDEITKSVLLISTISIFILIITGFIINRLVLKRLWMPFYKSMALIQNYRIGQKPYPIFGKTDITEFAMLNETLNTTISNSENEYKNLKEFTENAAHEMQTPLAVIRSKMDVLIQDEYLSESQSHIVQGAYDAIKKLSKLNQGLLLLSKIENHQFSTTDDLKLHVLLEEKINYFNEILQNKALSISYNILPVHINMNAALADILLNNLFGNCIKHSAPGGNIFISLLPDRLSISNGPFNKPLDENEIFNRFTKGGNSTDEHGLGLAIVKEICLVSGFTIGYDFLNNMHSFIVHFPRQLPS